MCLYTLFHNPEGKRLMAKIHLLHEKTYLKKPIITEFTHGLGQTWECTRSLQHICVSVVMLLFALSGTLICQALLFILHGNYWQNARVSMGAVLDLFGETQAWKEGSAALLETLISLLGFYFPASGLDSLCAPFLYLNFNNEGKLAWHWEIIMHIILKYQAQKMKFCLKILIFYLAYIIKYCKIVLISFRGWK